MEVDCVVYGEDGFWAVEVKGTSRVKPEDLRSLRAFKDEYPESTTVLLYRGGERLRMSGVLCVPCGHFLRQLHPARKGILPAS